MGMGQFHYRISIMLLQSKELSKEQNFYTGIGAQSSNLEASGIMLRLSYSAETVLRRENLCISTLPELVHLLKAQEFLSNPTNSNTLILIKCTAPWQNE